MLAAGFVEGIKFSKSGFSQMNFPKIKYVFFLKVFSNVYRSFHFKRSLVHNDGMMAARSHIVKCITVNIARNAFSWGQYPVAK